MKELFINIITMAVLAVSLGYLWTIALTTIN